jgi:type III pantothenate kinase
VSEPTLLAVDIGNTNVTLGIFVYGGAKAELAHHWRLATHREQTSDEVLVGLKGLCDLADFPIARVTDAIVSSVVPPLLPIWERVCTKLLGRPPLVVGTGIKTGMPVRYENPREVGADRIVNAVAAFELLGGPVIAVDFGTATTFDCVSAKGEYLGGAIFPGVEISLDALFGRAAGLRRVELVEPKHVIGKSSVESIQSGCIYGFSAQVDGLVDRFQAELGECAVIGTGGLGDLIIPHTRTVQHFEPWLTLFGLRIVFERNL